MSRKAAGKRIFSFSDLGHEKATTTRSCCLSFLTCFLDLALHHISVLFSLLISYFSPPYTLIVGLADLPRLLFLFVHPVCAVC